MLSMYTYNATTNLYSVAGRSGLCNIAKTLHLNVTSCIVSHDSGVVELDLSKSDFCSKELKDFVPYHAV